MKKPKEQGRLSASHFFKELRVAKNKKALVPINKADTLITKTKVTGNKANVVSSAGGYANKTTYYNSKNYVKSYIENPISIMEYSTDKHFSDFSYRSVVVLEKFKGKAINIFHDGTAVVFKNDNNITVPKGDDYLGYKTLFYEKYAHHYVDLAKRLKDVPFNLHGIIVGHDADSEIPYFKDDKKIEIYFYDIYLNDCWMDWDDFKELMDKFKLPIVPSLYVGSFEGVETLEILADAPNVCGIVIRPKYEDRDKGKRIITKITNKKFIKKTYAELSAILRPEVRLTMFQEFNNTHKLWEAGLRAQSIDWLDVKNLSKVMKYCSEKAMDEINKYLADSVYHELKAEYTKDEIIKTMKQELPSIIRNIMGLNTLRKL